MAPTPTVSAGAIGPRTIPAPPGKLADLVKLTTWLATTTIHRIHLDRFGAIEFNPGPNGNARFSPMSDATGKPVPTIYGGSTLDCAAMESVFHDVPFAPGLKTVAKRKLRDHLHSQVAPSLDLQLVDLSNTCLRKLGIARADLIDTEKDLYPQTRRWAEAIHEQCPGAQGLSWISRQDDKARALVLFEDRLPSSPLTIVGPSVDIVDDAATYAAIIDLAEEIGVKIVGR